MCGEVTSSRAWERRNSQLLARTTVCAKNEIVATKNRASRWSPQPIRPARLELPCPGRHTMTPPRPQRAAGARVILRDGALLGFLSQTGQRLLTYLPSDNPHADQLKQELVQALVSQASPANPLLLASVDGQPLADSPWAEPLMRAGFTRLSQGLVHRGSRED